MSGLIFAPSVAESSVTLTPRVWAIAGEAGVDDEDGSRGGGLTGVGGDEPDAIFGVRFEHDVGGDTACEELSAGIAGPVRTLPSGSRHFGVHSKRHATS